MSIAQEAINEEKENTIETQEHYEVKEVVDTALNAGRILLRNGAEIFRVEETITRICNRFGVTKVDIFTMSHGIFVSGENDEGESYTRVKHIPMAGANLEIVAEVNELSRRIAEGGVSLELANQILRDIEDLPPKRWQTYVLGSGLCSSGYGFLMGATITESLAAFAIGIVLGLWLILSRRLHLSKILTNSVGGVVITIGAIIVKTIFASTVLRFNGMIVGAIMPLVPGLAFTNAIRDIADSDILSGTVRMIDALMVFVYIAVGVGMVLLVYNDFTGGLLI